MAAKVVPQEQLELLLKKVRRRGLKRLSREEVLDLPRLYRRAHAELARRRAQGEPESSLRQAESDLARAHGLLHRESGAHQRGSRLGRAAHFLLHDCPRALRAEWRLALVSLVIVYGLALFAFVAVEREPSLAYSLLDPSTVRNEISQLESLGDGESFRGNFTFGVGESPQTAGWIMAHNMSVGILFFAAGLIPPLFLFLMATNGLMLGVYTAVAHSYGQAGAISSILWCHGVVEIQALVLAGCAGLVLFRGFLLPGPYSRAESMAQSGRRAWLLLAPTFPMLFVAGTIEGFVSPHAPLPVRLTVATGTGLMLITWAALGGREPNNSPQALSPPA